MPEPRKRPIGLSNAVLRNRRRPIPWIWDGVIALEAVTLLSAPEKAGKTTLLSLLLDRRRAGGALLGRDVYPGRTVLCSEENQHLWVLRQPPLDFGPDLLFHQTRCEYPSCRSWQRYIDELWELSFPEPSFDLLVIDTAASFLPLGDRSARRRRWAISQLSTIANAPAGVLLLNQSRTMHRPLAAFADIVIEMATPRGLGPTRRRTFTGVGRYPGTLQSASAELNPEGTDYVLLPDSPAPHPPLLTALQSVLHASRMPLTRREILTLWPGDPPREDSLCRVLARGLERGLFIATGAGTKTDPYRYAQVSEREQPGLRDMAARGGRIPHALGAADV